MKIATNLDDSRRFLETHTQITDKIHQKKAQMTESVLRMQNANDLSLLWSRVDSIINLRHQVLTKAVNFFQVSLLFTRKMDAATQLFNELQETEVNDYDTGYSIIDQHKAINKAILDSSLVAFDEGNELLTKLKELAPFTNDDSQEQAAFAYSNSSLETILEDLNTRRCHLEDLWSQRRIKLEQGIQICFLRTEINKSINWLISEGREYVDNVKLGLNAVEAVEMQKAHNEFVKEHYKPLQESVTRCMRSADQFIHTGLENADEAHAEAHELLEEWERFALKMEQRRKLLLVVGSFYRQTDEATNRLSQLEGEIKAERDKFKVLKKKKKKSRTRSPEKCPSPIEMTQRHIDLQSQVDEISAACLREGKNVLDKVDKNYNSECEHVVKKVFEFTEQVEEIKSKLADDIQDKLEKAVTSEDEAKKMNELIEFERGYSSLLAWLSNVGEAFLAHHRDMGVDVAYVADYVDSHEQMRLDLAENEEKLFGLLKAKDEFVSQCEDVRQAEKVAANFSQMEGKFSKLKMSVGERIRVAGGYLGFVKRLGQFRSIVADVQELLNESVVEGVFESHFNEKIQTLEDVYQEMIRSGKNILDVLKQVFNL